MRDYYENLFLNTRFSTRTRFEVFCREGILSWTMDERRAYKTALQAHKWFIPLSSRASSSGWSYFGVLKGRDCPLIRLVCIQAVIPRYKPHRKQTSNRMSNRMDLIWIVVQTCTLYLWERCEPRDERRRSSKALPRTTAWMLKKRAKVNDFWMRHNAHLTLC